MNARLYRAIRRLAAALLLLATAKPLLAIDSTAIEASARSADCLAYKVIGVCYWLLCTTYGCDVETSAKVQHYVPDAVVSSYSNTGKNPWSEVAAASAPTASAHAGGDGTTNQSHENNLAKFKNTDVIGHPAATAFTQYVSAFGYSCAGAGKPLVPYLLSTHDFIAWRYDIPEAVYPESLTPGVREIGSRASANLWGSVYPRGGFLHQADDYKTAAVVAQRAGDVVTRSGQIHVYVPLLAKKSDGYWPAGALVETNPKTGKWQDLTPTVSKTCAAFPNTGTHQQAVDGGYAFALWRPYSCCQRMGEAFLGSTDFQK
jgi:integrating conjugative element protein (TIGR03756 family)